MTRGLNIALIAVIGVILLASGESQEPKADAAPVAHDYTADIAKLQAELEAVKAERDEARAAYAKRDTEARAYQNDRDRLLMQTHPTAYVAAPRKAAPQPAAGQWVNVPVYGPLGRQRGTRREWQSNQPVQRIQYRGNCANGACR